MPDCGPLSNYWDPQARKSPPVQRDAEKDATPAASPKIEQVFVMRKRGIRPGTPPQRSRLPRPIAQTRAGPKLACDSGRGAKEGEALLPPSQLARWNGVEAKLPPHQRTKNDEDEKKARMRPGCHVLDSPHLVFPMRPTAVKLIESDESGKKQRSDKRRWTTRTG
jgi:hypothetical protein